MESAPTFFQNYINIQRPRLIAKWYSNKKPNIYLPCFSVTISDTAQGGLRLRDEYDNICIVGKGTQLSESSIG